MISKGITLAEAEALKAEFTKMVIELDAEQARRKAAEAVLRHIAGMPSPLTGGDAYDMWRRARAFVFGKLLTND